MPYIPHSDDEVQRMLATIGVERIEELWSSIPDKIRHTRPLNLPPALSELELIREVTALAEENRGADRMSCFLGGGTYHHYIPPAIAQLISRGEFYTAYTPYQPEVSQGTLQAIFEFQTMICELTGMEVANASMYDGAEAVAEAALMAFRLRPKNQEGPVAMASSLNPLYKRTIQTYLAHSGRRLVEVACDGSGKLDLDDLKNKSKGALAVVVQNPNYFGVIEELDLAGAVIKDAGAVFIAAVTEVMSLGLLEPPGSFGADIVAGEGQSLGIPMGLGGPHLGLLAGREADVRRMPGRLVGETVDHEGRRGFALTLATREQHIRRAKATSNICTNQGLMALAAAIYMTLVGPDRFRELALINRARAEHLKGRLIENNIGRLAFSGPAFNEFALDLGRPPGPIIRAMADKGFLAGIPLAPSGGDTPVAGRFPQLANSMLVTVTEMVSREEIDAFVEALSSSLKEARS